MYTKNYSTTTRQTGRVKQQQEPPQEQCVEGITWVPCADEGVRGVVKQWLAKRDAVRMQPVS